MDGDNANMHLRRLLRRSSPLLASSTSRSADRASHIPCSFPLPSLSLLLPFFSFSESFSLSQLHGRGLIYIAVSDLPCLVHVRIRRRHPRAAPSASRPPPRAPRRAALGRSASSADHLLTSFLEHFPTFPNSFLIGGAADYFVIELTAPEAKLEPVLVHYLSRMTILQGWELRMSTSTRLKSCLHSFTSPGGRAYPRRVVRHEAWNTLDLLYLM
ncbi:hypothetical protein ZWY2020_051988 [Hordeum vulgare]|nr:hypothetical protein ZWY2020_051988 [Hordeum vulgare]